MKRPSERPDAAGVWDAVARVDAGDLEAAAQRLRLLHPADQADVLAALSTDERRRLLDHIDSSSLSLILEFLTPDELEQVAPDVELDRLAEALDETPAHRAADVLQAIPEAAASAVLDQLPSAELVEPLLEHDDDSAGGIMAPEIITLGPHDSAQQAIDHLRATAAAAPTVRDLIYVVDSAAQLLGSVHLHDLITARPHTHLRELMTEAGPSVATDTHQEEALQILQRYGLHALPVVDRDGRLVGVTTADDLLQIAQEEATSDMFRLVGLVDDEALTAPIDTAVRRRLPWLLLNLATAFAAAAVVAAFEDTLARVAALAIFLPIIAGQGGNAGMQVTTLTVRAMALGEFDRRFHRTVLPREIAIGIVTGIALGLLVGAVGWVWQSNPWLGVAVGVAMLATMIISGLAGLLIPVLLRRTGADPALAAGILVTTVTDVLGFLFFLGLANLLIDRIA